MRVIMLFCITLVMFGCKTIEQKKNEEKWDFNKYMMESQNLTSAERYLKSIDLLKEAAIKFPDGDLMGINYNIGYNYYKLKRYDDANGYFNLVIKSYEEKPFTDAEKQEYQKYVILSNIIIEKAKKDIEEAKDPYRIKEEMEENRKLRPKK
ncbi:MAG TPA: hypothetical protein PK385_02960 [Spirochaetota bacterium]|nr:hypothetical protein [Spirochaetota bacterium]HOS32014.1 hypothetical protein [Spirochaetota bacterium]HOS54998.1 hypothetical protein [Spirochaetota bacterium]HPK61306.1 hypothetical protein [Spirochaetota bacterium]HQF77585.1 hypothetical protein [Spirochaetota bacterium]